MSESIDAFTENIGEKRKELNQQLPTDNENRKKRKVFFLKKMYKTLFVFSLIVV